MGVHSCVTLRPLDGAVFCEVTASACSGRTDLWLETAFIYSELNQ